MSRLLFSSRLPFTCACVRCKARQGLQPSGGIVLHNNRMKLTKPALAFAAAVFAAYPGVVQTRAGAKHQDADGLTSRTHSALRRRSRTPTPCRCTSLALEPPATARGEAVSLAIRRVTALAVEGQAPRHASNIAAPATPPHPLLRSLAPTASGLALEASDTAPWVHHAGTAEWQSRLQGNPLTAHSGAAAPARRPWSPGVQSRQACAPTFRAFTRGLEPASGCAPRCTTTGCT